MISLTYFLKLKKKVFSNQEDLDNKSAEHKRISFNRDLLKSDLFCHLTYMSALATSKLPRNLLFDYAATLPYTSSRYFRKVHFLAKKLSYDYSEACRMVGETTKEPEAKAILLRMAGALASGEPEDVFLAREAYAMGETFGDEYERSVENLKKWTDAFVALILSASLIVVISAVSMLIFPMKPIYLITLTWFMLMSTVLGAWVMYRASPKEIKTHNLPQTSFGQRLGKSLFKFMVIPAAVILIFLMLTMKTDLGWSMLVMAIILLPTGFIVVWDDNRIDNLDSDIAGFLRSLGGVSKAIGTTVTEAVGRLDFGSLASLKKFVISLNSSLLIGIQPDLCWRRFVSNTGSEHINRSIQIFWDGVAVGGDPERVGSQSSKFAMKVALLRAKRKLVSANFSYTVMIIHGTISLLLVGIYQVLLNFSKLLETMSGSDVEGNKEMLTQLPTFQFFTDSNSQIGMLYMMVIAMLIVLTIVDAAAIKVVDGGHTLKFLFYLGIMLAISGMSLLIIPDMLKGIFSTLQMGS
jgi:archaeal flagellar protein FlaJ